MILSFEWGDLGPKVPADFRPVRNERARSRVRSGRVFWLNRCGEPRRARVSGETHRATEKKNAWRPLGMAAQLILNEALRSRRGT